MLGSTDVLKELENYKRTLDANTLLILELYARVKKLEDTIPEFIKNEEDIRLEMMEEYPDDNDNDDLFGWDSGRN